MESTPPSCIYNLQNVVLYCNICKCMVPGTRYFSSSSHTNVGLSLHILVLLRVYESWERGGVLVDLLYDYLVPRYVPGTHTDHFNYYLVVVLAKTFFDSIHTKKCKDSVCIKELC